MENLSLSTFITYEPINEGYALFNWFSGNTHFLTSEQGELICYLAKNNSSFDELFAHFSKRTNLSTDDSALSFKQFISEAITNEILISH